MNLEKCFLCKKPVLELSGQFEKLDSYLLEEYEPAYLEKAFGWCHSLCLSLSAWGKFWSTRRIEHLHKKLNYQLQFQDEKLTILINRNQDEILFIKPNGVSYSLKENQFFLGTPPGKDMFLAIVEDFNLELDNSVIVQKIQNRLIKDSYVSLIDLVEILDISDCFLYPEVLPKSKIVFDPILQEEWFGNWISAKIEYFQFFPKNIIDSYKLSAK